VVIDTQIAGYGRESVVMLSVVLCVPDGTYARLVVQSSHDLMPEDRLLRRP
jgi:hypothetical protein